MMEDKDLNENICEKCSHNMNDYCEKRVYSYKKCKKCSSYSPYISNMTLDDMDVFMI